MSASRSASGNFRRNAGTTFETPSFLSSGVPISTMVTPPASAAAATPRPCSIVATSTEIWKVKRVLSRSRTPAEAEWVTFAACWAQAWAGRIISNVAPTVSAPVANLPAPLRNDRRSMLFLRVMSGVLFNCRLTSVSPNEQQRLIVELPAMRARGTEEAIRNLRQRPAVVLREQRLRAVQAEIAVLRVEHLNQSVGNERQEISGLYVHG